MTQKTHLECDWVVVAADEGAPLERPAAVPTENLREPEMNGFRYLTSHHAMYHVL